MICFQKCCSDVRLSLRCLLIGFTTLILSLELTISSIWILAVSEETLNVSLVDFKVNHVKKEAIIVIVLILSVLWMMTSISLIIGVKMNKPGLVLIYFAFGIFITLFATLSSLLLVLGHRWRLASGLSIATLNHIWFLVTVHKYYDLQAGGKISMERLVEDNDNEIFDSPSIQ